MSVRTYLASQIAPLLPADWVFIDHDKTLSNIGRVTAVLVHTRVEPADIQGALLHTVSLVIVDPTQQEETADSHLDDHLEDLIPILQGIPNVAFVDAEKGTRDEFPAYVINLTVKTTA